MNIMYISLLLHHVGTWHSFFEKVPILVWGLSQYISLWLPRCCCSIPRLRCAFPLHFATPPTPEQADSAKANSWVSRPGGRRTRLFCAWLNVLLPPRNTPFHPPPVEKGIPHSPFQPGSGATNPPVSLDSSCHLRALPSIGCRPPRERCPLWNPHPTGRSAPLLDDPEPKELPSLWNPSPF